MKGAVTVLHPGRALILIRPLWTRIYEWLTVTALIARREIRSLFSSWIAYVTLTFFAFLIGLMFISILQLGEAGQMRVLYWNTAIILIFVLPIVTMRLLAEERRLGTLELLLTSPVTDWQVVVGKFSAGFFWLLTGLALSLYVPYLINRFSGGTADLGPYWTAYIGLAFFAAPLIAIGVFWSSVTDNQIIAAMGTFGTYLLLYIINWPTEGAAGWAEIFRKISLYYRFQDFTAGLIKFQDIVYYLCWTFLALYLSVQVLASRRWR
ncbi:MAG: ABC transporter permease [Armatimonadetes bacterium]|nr:ABC transporter permease [Armatimonadota bacterium]MDW8121874.1 ABC transporter permease subunit [Armatimonadota bacterium]